MYQLSDLLHDRVQVAKPGAKVLQMHAQHAASARREHFEVATLSDALQVRSLAGTLSMRPPGGADAAIAIS